MARQTSRFLLQTGDRTEAMARKMIRHYMKTGQRALPI